MKKLNIILLAIFSFGLVYFVTDIAQAGYVNGYYRSNGTYVDGYYRSDANGLKYDNYSWSSGDDYYNDSYYDSSYSSDWNTPSWQTQDDYWTGLDSYSTNNDYDGWFDSGYDDYWGY